MNKRNLILIQIVLALAAFAGSVYVSVAPANSLLNWYNIDDAFYYYKVAQNVINGYGFTFDQINLSNGFHPLWMVVCLSVFWLTKYNLLLPLRVLVLVSGLFNAATVLLLFRLLKRYLHPAAAFAGAFTWGLYPPIYDVVTTHGMESAISAFFIVLLLLKATSYLDEIGEKQITARKLVGLGVIGALAILARLDNLFVVGLIGIFLLFKIKKIPVMVIFDALVVSMAVFLAWIIRLGSEGVIQNTYTIYPMLVVSILIKPVFLYFGGCYSTLKPLNRFKMILRVGLAYLAAFIFEYVVFLILFKLNITKMFSNSIIAIDAAIGLILVLAVHLLQFKSIQAAALNPFSTFGNWVKNHWKPTLTGGLAYGTPIAILVGAYMIFNKLVFGSFTPVSGQIKHWWSTMDNTIYGRPVTLISVLGLGTSGGNGPWSIVTSKVYETAASITKLFTSIQTEVIFGILLVILVVLVLLLMKAENGKLARKLFTLLVPATFIGSIIHITYYTATGYTHTRSWYWVAEMLTLVIVGSLILDGIFSWMDRKKHKIQFSKVLAGLFAVYISMGFITYITGLVPQSVSDDKKAAYLAETREVEFYTEINSKIGMTGGGMVAYFIEERTIVNLDGLINSKEYFEAMQNGKATQFLDNIPLSYVYGKPYTLLQSDPYDEIFKDRLVEIGYIRGYESFTLFEYKINQ